MQYNKLDSDRPSHSTSAFALRIVNCLVDIPIITKSYNNNYFFALQSQKNLDKTHPWASSSELCNTNIFHLSLLTK